MQAITFTVPPHSRRISIFRAVFIRVGCDANDKHLIPTRYKKGKAVGRDLNKAAEWYEQAAELGLDAARERLDKLGR